MISSTPLSSTPPLALLLNSNFDPIKVIPWQRAVRLVLEEKADLINGYVGRLVRSVSISMQSPAVVRLRRFVEVRGRIRFNRQNVLARDYYQCQFCGIRPVRNGRPDLEELTLDHVIPRAQSKNGRVTLKSGRSIIVTCWDNVVCACQNCNLRKADRTPEQAGMRLLAQPRTPSMRDVFRISLTRILIPDEWKEYIPADSDWRNYWEAELSSD